MEDGSGRCLLDVISDPSALSEFLESQALLDGVSSPTKAHSFQSTPVSNQVQVTRTMNTSLTSNNAVTSQHQFITQTSALPKSTVQNVTNTIPAVSRVNTSNSQTVVRSMNGSVNVSNSPVIIPISNKSSSPINNLVNVTKGIAMSPATYQGKKPIPIQPKNAVILPNTSIQSGVNVLGNIHPGLVSQTATSVVSNQLHGGVLPRGSAINGVDSSKSRTTTLQPRTTQPTILSTPPKRIAPKQVLSPSTNASLPTMSPVRIQQASLQNKQNIQLATQLLQAQNVAGANSNANKIFSQHLAAVAQPLTNNNQSSAVQSSKTNTAQPVQQIQQLINDKLSGQQAFSAPVQQKVFTQAQLETALKQSQLLAQNSTGQQQNILVQQQILKQLILQAQQLQQKAPVKTTTSNINIQPVTTNTQGIVQQQQVRQVVPQQMSVASHLQPAGSQIQMVLPNQQIVTLAQNALQTNQQNSIAAQNIANVNSANLNQTAKTNTQPIIIVSQSGGNYVLQQNLKASSSGIATTTATTFNIPLQSLINQQQKQVASQLTNTPRQNQLVPQQVKVGETTVLQVNQPKQVGQQQTILVQNQVGQAQNVAKTVGAQQNVIFQTKPNVTTTQASTTIHQLTPAQLQQLQNMGGVQKVLIIKQPEVAQKLANTQGAKAPQAIQITPQQLQVLQQIQNPQTSTGQKIIIQSRSDGNNSQTTVLTAQQLKQLQQSLQQGGNAKIIQIPQGQRQVLVQQTQQQSNKTTGKMTHVPRILQTTGRHAANQASKSSSAKQEPNRGVKRPHTDTPEPPKVVRRLKSALYQDQQSVLHPDIHNPFKSRLEAIKKLSSYHVCHDPGQTPSDVEKSEQAFENVASQLMKRSEKMMDKYRSLMLTESTRREPSSEMVMLYRLYLADERASLAQNKQQLAEELKILRSMPQVSMPPPSTPVVNSTPSTNSEKTPEYSEPTLAKPRTPSPLEDMETNKELDILTADALLAAPEDHSLLTNDDEDDDGDEEEEEDEEKGSDVDMEENEIDKAVFNMESSTSYYEAVNHLSDSMIDSPRTNTPHNDGDDSVDELLVDDDDMEKEDVTATLALLHSMAEELDGVIS